VGRPEESDVESPVLDALRRAEVSAVVPLRAGSVTAGVLLLGPRPSADPYGRFDLTALRALAVPAGLALEHALLLREHTERERLAALGKLSAVIIHEIKNPLGIIRVSSGTLKKRFAPADSGHELASFIEEEVMRMDRTIGQFLRFARPSQPKVTRFDLADLARRAVEALRAELEQAGITLSCELPEELPVRGDPDQLQQVMLNLLLNAQQALDGRQQPRIELCLRRGGSPPVAELLVRDNGPGIDPAVEARIFEPFFTTRPGGTGLGLAIVRQLLQDQGGRISVRTGARGTEFRVLLPAA
jgi:two-component system sensor histidine kinase HydH